MKSSNEMKQEPEKLSENFNDNKKSTDVKKAIVENRIEEQIMTTNAEKESQKNISRWDTDGGTDLCP